MKEILKESNLEAYLDYFDRDKKSFSRRRYIMAVLFTMLYAVSILMMDQQLLFLVMPFIAFLGYKIPYLTLLREKKERDLINSYLFPEFLTSFLACLAGSSENVYQALRETLPYTRGSLKKELKKLIKGIQQGNNRQDYLAFAEYIGSSEAYMVMSMIYEFSIYGIKEDSLKKLSLHIQDIDENKMNELIDSKMNKAENLGILPILILIIFIGGFAGTLLLHYYFTDVVDAFNIL